MKTLYAPRFLLPCTLAAALFSARGSLQAQTFAYTNCDLVAGFRMSGGSYDLVVDLGPVAAFENLTPRSITPITRLSATQLGDAFPSLDGVTWSVSAVVRSQTYPDPNETLWVTSPRPDIYTPGRAWTRQSQWTLGGAAGQIDAIGAFAAVYGNAQPAGPDNSPTGILIPTGNQYAYDYLIGSYGDFAGTFQGNAENTTPDDFDTAGLPSRSVLYKLIPATGSDKGSPGSIIGFFDFKPDGTMSFTAGPPPERTAISKIAHQGTTTTVWFPTISLVGYRLRYTDAAGLSTPVSTWSVGAALVGDGTALSLQDTSSTSNRFYAVEAYY